MGKPALSFFEEILSELGIDAAKAAMVGDDIESDIGGAQQGGLAGILVQTGKYREEAVRASGIEPTATVGNYRGAAGAPRCLSPTLAGSEACTMSTGTGLAWTTW